MRKTLFHGDPATGRPSIFEDKDAADRISFVVDGSGTFGRLEAAWGQAAVIEQESQVARRRKSEPATAAATVRPYLADDDLCAEEAEFLSVSPEGRPAGGLSF